MDGEESSTGLRWAAWLTMSAAVTAWAALVLWSVAGAVRDWDVDRSFGDRFGGAMLTGAMLALAIAALSWLLVLRKHGYASAVAAFFLGCAYFAAVSAGSGGGGR